MIWFSMWPLSSQPSGVFDLSMFPFFSKFSRVRDRSKRVELHTSFLHGQHFLASDSCSDSSFLSATPIEQIVPHHGSLVFGMLLHGFGEHASSVRGDHTLDHNAVGRKPCSDREWLMNRQMDTSRPIAQEEKISSAS